MSEAVTKKYLDQRFGKIDQGFGQIDKKFATLTKAMTQGFTEAKKDRESIRQELRDTKSELSRKIDSGIEELAAMTQRGFTAVHEQIKNITVFEIRQIKKDVHNIQGRVTLIEAALDMSK